MIAPCMPQTAMIISVVGRYGGRYLALVFVTLIAVAMITAFILNKIIKGETPPIIIEIPPYRMPRPATLFKKLWMRIRGFLLEAIPLIILGIFVINILDSLGFIEVLANIFGAPMKYILGLPKETVSVFEDAADPDYQTILRAIEEAKDELDTIKRFDMPDFRPREEYLREMRRFGVLSAHFDASDT